MDSRERTFLSLKHEEPDRVPVDCWFSPAMKTKLETSLNISYEQFLDQNSVDLRYIEGPRYIGPQLTGSDSASEIDIWGVSRKKVQIHLKDETGEYTETYKEVTCSPLQYADSVEEILEYPHWPSADWFDYSRVEKQCRKIRDAGRVVVFMGDRLNRLAQLKPAFYLRGFEQVFCDMIENHQIARALFKQIADFYLEYGQRILEAAKGKIDILCTGDDFGAQDGPFLSLSMWIDFLKKGFEEYIKLGKAHGAYVMHHTCGSVYSLIPEMINSNLDILQSLQPEVAGMNPKILKDEFGDRLSFQGGVSIQKVLPYGSPADVREHVKTLLEIMASQGGYIACTSHNIQADTPLCNVEALFETYKKYGRYY